MNSSASIVEQHTVNLSWDFDVDTNDTTTSLKLPLQTRFGEVVLEVTVKEPQHILPKARFEAVDPGAIGCNFKPSAKLYWIDEAGGASAIHTGIWHFYSHFPRGPAPSSSLSFDNCSAQTLQTAEQTNSNFNRLTHRRYRCVFTFAGFTLPSATLHPLSARKIRDDVSCRALGKFFFLSSSSPYFKTLLASDDFVESVRLGRKRPKIEEGEADVRAVGSMGGREDAGAASSLLPRGAKPAGDIKAPGDDSDNDSDDDSDNFVKRRCRPSVEDGGDDGDFTYREVKISQTPYTTYRALLLYLHSGYITFAPLSSNLLPRNPRANQTREQLLDKYFSSTPSLPFPVSPKSVYRLADLLEIPTLSARSLAEIKLQLTINNAARELFSKTNSLYDDLLAVILAFVVEHWAEVKASDGMKEMEAKARSGQLPHAAAIFFELLPLVSK